MAEKDYFGSRGTVRTYTDRQISEEELSEMIALASHAPNTGNMQWYCVIVTRGSEKKKALAPAHFNQPQVENASAVLTFCVDLNRFEKWCRLNNAEPGYENFQSFVAAMIDASLFAQQFCTVAEMRGFGTCYLGTTTYNAHQIAEILNLPERVVPVTTVTVGYPSVPLNPSWRLPVEAIMHNENYIESTDGQINSWYNPLEQDSQHYVEENGKETLAQVFTDIRYPKDSNEFFSRIYLDFISRNKFL